jgi:hypothetical protein
MTYRVYQVVLGGVVGNTRFGGWVSGFVSFYILVNLLMSTKGTSAAGKTRCA